MKLQKWGPISDWPDYAVSSRGEVMRLTSHKRAKAGQVLAQFKVCGYPSVNLSNRDGTRKSLRVHRLVAEAFLERPEGATEVNHIDATRDNNNVDNLEWVTSGGNRLHAYQHGALTAQGESNGYSKLTEQAVREIRDSGISAVALAEKHRVSKATILDVRARRTWRHVT